MHAARRARRARSCSASCSRPVPRWPDRRSVRGSSPVPPLRLLDSLGGVLLGAAGGLAVVWVVGAVAPLPGAGASSRGRAGVRGSCAS